MWVKRLSLCLVFTCFSLVLAACNEKTSDVTEGNNDSPLFYHYHYSKSEGNSQFDFPGNFALPELTLDGVRDEEAWGLAESDISFGQDGNATVYFYRGNEALYVFFEVMDSDILSVGEDQFDVPRSDSVEFYLDVGNTGGNHPSEGDFQFNIGVHGVTRNFLGSGEGWSLWNGLIDYGIKVNGTLNDGNDVDTSYAIELMIPYAQIGMTKESELGIALGHVNKAGSDNHDFKWHGWTVEEKLIDPQIPDQYIVYTKDNKFYMKDKTEVVSSIQPFNQGEIVGDIAVVGNQPHKLSHENTLISKRAGRELNEEL